MAKWLGIVLGVLLLLIGALLLAARNLDRILNKNRPAIEAQVSSALGRTVSFEALSASLGWGVSARVDGLRVGDDPSFSKEDFLRVGQAQIQVNLLPLFRGRVEVGKISIREPDIRVIQTAKGLNLSTLGGKAPAAPESSSEAAPLALAVANLEIIDARLSYVDRSVQPPSETRVNDLDLSIATQGTLEAFRGRIQLAAQEIRTGAGGEGAAASWEPLRFDARVTRDVGLIRISDATLELAEMVAEIAASFRYDAQRAAIEELVVKIFDGEIRAAGSYRPQGSRFDLETHIAAIDLAKAIAMNSSSGADLVEGKLYSDLKLRGAGAAWQTLAGSLSGGGEMRFEELLLRDVNLAEASLGGITGVPGLSGLLPPALREKYPALFATGDTAFESMRALAEIGAGKLRLTELVAAARDYQLLGTGVVELANGKTDLATQLVASEALSADLVERASKLGALRNPEGRVVIPARIRGVLPNLKPQPDVEYVAKALGREAAAGLLDKALGDSKEGSGLKEGLKSLFGR